MKKLFAKSPVLVRFRVVFFAILMLIIGMSIISGCGANNDNKGTSSGGNLYITDDVSTEFQNVFVTIYKIELFKKSDGSSFTVFENTTGESYDLRSLSGILEKISNVLIPVDKYNRILITVGEELVLVDNAGTKVNPSLAENRKTHCSDGMCVIEVTGAINVINHQKVVLDFDLKQFKYNAVSNKVTAKVVLDADGKNHTDYVEKDDDDEIINESDCSSTGRSIEDFTSLSSSIALTGPFQYTLNTAEHSITIADRTFLVTDETLLKLETSLGVSDICFDSIPPIASEIDILYYEGQNSEGESVLIAYNVLLKQALIEIPGPGTF